MSTIDLNICKVSDKGTNILVSIPYWIPTQVIQRKNEQKYYDIELHKSLVVNNSIPLQVVLNAMNEVKERNPYKFLRLKNPHIVDYMQTNLCQFAPKKQIIKASAEVMEQKRTELRNINMFVVPDFSVCYVEMK